jgi:hypothetical protein
MRHLVIGVTVLTVVLAAACRRESESASSAASAAGGEPSYHARPSYGNPPGTGTTPGTTKALAPGQGTFVRTTEPLSSYESEQGTSEADVAVTQQIRRAIADEPSLTDAGRAVTVITHGEHVVLLGQVPTERERETIEALARAHSSDVASHLEIQGQ